MVTSESEEPDGRVRVDVVSGAERRLDGAVDVEELKTRRVDVDVEVVENVRGREVEFGEEAVAGFAVVSFSTFWSVSQVSRFFFSVGWDRLEDDYIYSEAIRVGGKGERVGDVSKRKKEIYLVITYLPCGLYGSHVSRVSKYTDGWESIPGQERRPSVPSGWNQEEKGKHTEVTVHSVIGQLFLSSPSWNQVAYSLRYLCRREI